MYLPSTPHFCSQWLLSSADNLCKQIVPRPTECSSWSGFKMFDTLIVFLKEFFEKVNFEKNQQTTTKAWNVTQHAKSKWPFPVISENYLRRVKAGLCILMEPLLFTRPPLKMTEATPVMWDINPSWSQPSTGSRSKLKVSTVKPVDNGLSQKDQKLVFVTNYPLMQVKSITEWEHSAMNGSILQYFRPSLCMLPFVIKTFVLSIFRWPLWQVLLFQLFVMFVQVYRLII